MVAKRPHILRYQPVVATPPLQDSNGRWVVNANTAADKLINCRAEPNGSAQTIVAEDGANIRYSYMVYTDKETEKIPFGVKIQVFSGLDLLISGKVLAFSKDQKHCRIWV